MKQSVLDQALDLHRRLTLAKVKSDYKALLSEAYLRDAFELEPRAGKEMSVDLSGRTMSFISSRRRPILVNSKLLEADIFVISDVSNSDEVEFLGWLDRESVEQAPVMWVQRNGKRVDYNHEVLPEFLRPLPRSLDFVSACEHDASMWDDYLEGWMCFLCDRAFYDVALAERIHRDNGTSDPTAT